MSSFFKLSGNNHSGLILLADHASNHLPQTYGTLGLFDHDLQRHIAYDIGIKALTHALSARLKVPAILSNFSRLLIDPNRGLQDPTLITQLSDGAVIPGNYPMNDFERQKRIKDFYNPYDQAIKQTITEVEKETKKSPMVVSLHSFTPIWRGTPRPWQIGLLWDTDDRVFSPLYDGLQKFKDLTIGNNQPYDGALKGDTMNRHCTENGIAHILIEIRQDLLETDAAIEKWVDNLAPLLSKINEDPSIHTQKYFTSRAL
ncbi:N-formylglutamate amidohydrolase [Bartonella tamiae]|uniref:N-formylglutamate amidohydrolase n=1 Tax=Bartonella tamiae Th239 TaxID=1094558 RepID=J1K2Q6_9HYPH|nr:N-formylglutamate amidohydrolase [Bartonella tamiae]EJF91772.1 hypothetical protein ME5_00151 [Bartonella tamiae Th239]EJF92560.1 hypothetical protein MEG_01730 [Bartonella tamiae Th307]